MANRARLLGEGGSTCDSFTELSGAVAKTELAAKVLGLRLRRGEGSSFSTGTVVAKKVPGGPCIPMDLALRLRLGEANPGGALNPSGLGVVAGGHGASMSMGSEAVSACAGGGVKNKGGC